MPAAMLSLWPAGIRGGAGGGGGTDGEGMVMLASGFSASVRASIEAEHTSGGGHSKRVRWQALVR